MATEPLISLVSAVGTFLTFIVYYLGWRQSGAETRRMGRSGSRTPLFPCAINPRCDGMQAVQRVAVSKPNAQKSIQLRAAVPPKRKFVALSAIVAVSMALGGCSPFAGFVADHWPHWAGGMPEGVPPRPGAPGYDQFIAHGQDVTGAPKPADADTKAAPKSAEADAKAAPRSAPQPAPRRDGDGMNGGLY